MPTYLENSNPKNHRFYERHGYVSRGAYRPVWGGPVLDPMWREAGGKAALGGQKQAAISLEDPACVGPAVRRHDGTKARL